MLCVGGTPLCLTLTRTRCHSVHPTCESFHLCGLSPGIIGGKFLERGRVKKPNQMPYSTQLSEYYTAPDLYVGAVVDFNKHKFVLMDADEYAFRYMEEHPMEVSYHTVLS